MTLFADFLIARRGRGIARLIEGISEGDPVSIGIAVVAGLVIVGMIVYNIKKKQE